MKSSYKESYKLLISQLERLGGNLTGVSPFYSIANEAIVRKRLKEVQSKEARIEPTQGPNKVSTPLPYANESPPNKLPEGDLIVDFPVALHLTYRTKKEAWLKACSLKLELNQVHVQEEAQACKLQKELWKLFELMDDCDQILNHWKKYKKILTHEKKDYSSFTPTELVQRRNTLRSNIVSREKSLSKWKQSAEDLTNAGEEVPFSLKEKISRKTEELQQIKMEVKELDKLIK